MPVKAATKSTAAPRKRRTRKTTAKTVTPVTKQTPIKEVKKVTVKTPVRPSTLLKTEDYINDIKIRFEIHNYE
ncbi:MAG: hypothetical protein VYE26_01435, partial [Pseudomonadota bacterium]|nr:hypothetical protein [Pseudomonadota bacterium]